MTTRPEDDLTIEPTGSSTPAGVATPPPSVAGRFAPGAIVAGRYRLVTLIGRGGMGEVYRAEDLTLDQPVALKSLPGHVAASDARLAQFHNELRVARQVSHKNVPVVRPGRSRRPALPHDGVRRRGGSVLVVAAIR